MTKRTIEEVQKELRCAKERLKSCEIDLEMAKEKLKHAENGVEIATESVAILTKELQKLEKKNREAC